MNWNSTTQEYTEVKSSRVVAMKHFANAYKGLISNGEIAKRLGVSTSRISELQRKF